MEKPEKWQTCLNVLKYEQDRILLVKRCPGAHKRKGTLVLDIKKCGACTKWRGWQEKTREEIEKIKKEDCKNCAYSLKRNDQNGYISCNYIDITGHRRPCLPGNCRAAGIFKGRKGEGKCF